MVIVKQYDWGLGLRTDTFNPIYLGDKTALIRPDANRNFEVGQIVQIINLDDRDRVCEVEITHIDRLCDDLALLSITLVA